MKLLSLALMVPLVVQANELLQLRYSTKSAEKLVATLNNPGLVPQAKTSDTATLKAEPSTGSAQRNTVIVQNFENRSNLSRAVVERLELSLEAQLAEYGVFVPVARNKLTVLVKEQTLMVSGRCSQKQCLVRLGELSGAALGLSTVLTKIGTTYHLNCRLIDLTSAAVMDVYQTPLGVSEKDLDIEINQAAQKLSGKVTTAVVEQQPMKERVKRLLNPPILQGWWTITTNVPAKVYWGTMLLGKTPLKEIPVIAGKKTLSIDPLDQSKYCRILYEVDLPVGKHFSRHYKLPVMTGDLSIVSDPPGARVLSGAKELGQTPLTLTGQTLGKHRFVINKAGYHPHSITLVVYPSQQVEYRYPLNPIQVPLRIICTVPDAEMFMDGKYLGTVGKTVSVLPGHHTLRVVKSQFNDHEQSIEVPVVHGATLEVTLQPYATVHFNYVPNNATLYIANEEQCSQSPCAIVLKKGMYAVQLKKQKYHVFETNLRVRQTGEENVLLKMTAFSEYDDLQYRLQKIKKTIDALNSESTHLTHLASNSSSETLISNYGLYGEHTFWGNGALVAGILSISMGITSMYVDWEICDKQDPNSDCHHTVIDDIDAPFTGDSAASFIFMTLGASLGALRDLFYVGSSFQYTSLPYKVLNSAVLLGELGVLYVYLKLQGPNSEGSVYAHTVAADGSTANTIHQPKNINKFFQLNGMLLLSLSLSELLFFTIATLAPSHAEWYQKKAQRVQDKTNEYQREKERIQHQLEGGVAFEWRVHPIAQDDFPPGLGLTLTF
ncbi:MAG: hypothetical protein A2284_13280 [Deltaproteobacteria bacterium RIFOXYA12_FULL_61_11]|nr:MAG: hypothetical protein A2284_13280 [Deltaproteobacteria bacterium RIFOXYA12_FULL_61_11]